MKNLQHIKTNAVSCFTINLATTLAVIATLVANVSAQAQTNSSPQIQVIPPTEPITEPHPAPKPKALIENKTAPAIRKLMTPGQEIAKKEQLKLSPEERKVIQELFETTLKPLTLERIDFDMALLAQHKICVEKSKTAEAFKDCDFDFLQARREKSEELIRKIELKRAELDKKYHITSTPKKEHPFFQLNSK